MSETEAPIACTLDTQSLAQRIADTRKLFATGLRGVRRDGRSLHLTFDPTVRAEVADLARKEKECCAFLDFALEERKDAVVLTITAPAGSDASALLAPFAELASGACGCGGNTTKEQAPFWRRIGLLGATGTIACVAACAIPIGLASAGLGLASLGTIALLADWRVLLAALVALSLVAGIVVRRWRMKLQRLLSPGA